jgi:putative SOS response-associated peptidase YedK
MCGRYVSPAESEIERFWHIGRHNYDPFGRLFNVAPSTQIPLLRVSPEAGELELAMARWGLIPFWWKKPKPPNFTFNTRIEEAANKSMWREVVKTSRCLIPAVGWYEWEEVEVTDPATGEIKKVKQPHFLHLPGDRLLAFAGVTSSWTPGEREPAMLTCSILTRAAEGPAAEIHERMPVVLPQPTHVAWLDPEQTDAGKVLGIAREVAVSQVEFYPVSKRVNNSKNEGAGLIEPLERTV